MSNLKKKTVRQGATVKKAEKSKKAPTKKAPKTMAAASKTKKAPPPKKVVKPVAKAKAKANEKTEKKIAAKAAVPEKSKKVAPPPPPAPKKEDLKKNVAAKVAAPVKSKVEEKPAPTKTTSSSKAGASASPQKAAPAEPIKAEPKIIEAPEPEFKARAAGEQLFTQEEIDMFRDLLETERNKILSKARKAMEEGNIQIDKNEMFDEVDQASAMIEQNLMFRLLDRDRKLLTEIDHALAKIESGDYGYCEGTGEPIPKRRLELRPWCRHSVKYKEKLERMKKSGRGVADEDEL